MREREEPISEGDPEATGELFRRLRGGDEAARERLFARCLPRLQRWAHRRLPLHYRDIADTDDLVQLTLLRAFRHLDSFEWRGEGAFLAYLRSILLNAVRDEVRKSATRSAAAQASEARPETVAPAGELSELERLIHKDQMHRYEAALDRLPERDRCALILRLEFELDYRELAQAIEAPGPDAARMAVQRARARLVQMLQSESAAG